MWIDQGMNFRWDLQTLLHSLEVFGVFLPPEAVNLRRVCVSAGGGSELCPGALV